MTINPDLLLLAGLLVLVAFAAGAGSGTFLGSIWAKAKAWEASEAAKAKADVASIEHAVARDEEIVKLLTAKLKEAVAQVKAEAEEKVAIPVAYAPVPARILVTP